MRGQEAGGIERIGCRLRAPMQVLAYNMLSNIKCALFLFHRASCDIQHVAHTDFDLLTKTEL